MFKDRHEAGIELANRLENYANNPEVLVLALPRGGVPIAYEISKHLNLKMDLLIARKLGMPGYEELAIGAVAMDEIFLNEDLIEARAIDKEQIEKEIDLEKQELIERNKKYRNAAPFPDITDKTIIIVDDGIATGATINAALKALRQQEPYKIIAAVPVMSSSSYQTLNEQLDEIVSLVVSDNFEAVGQFYQDFHQINDNEMLNYLE